MKIENMKVTTKLALGFVTVVIVFVIIIVASFSSFSKYGTANKWNTHTYEVLNEVNSILLCLVNIETGQRGFVVAGKDEFLEPYNQGKQDLEKHFAKVKDLTADNPKQQERLNNLLSNYKKLITEGIDPLIGARREVASGKGTMDTVIREFSAAKGKTIMDAMRGQLKEIGSVEEKLLAERSQEMVSLQTQTGYLMTVGGILGILMSIGAAAYISRSISRQLGADPRKVAEIANLVADGDLRGEISVASGDSTSVMASMKKMVGNLRDMATRLSELSSSVASASNELHSTSAQIATGAEEVASQTNTVAASEEMAATSGDIARNCALAADASRQSTEAANAGAGVVQETIAGMNIIADRVRQSSQTVEALGARSEQIGDIVGTIEDIADQTNLLALNAAIEAARAGEQGRGFAVVADEVRALAERTTKATREISEMIKAIQSETQNAVKAMDVGVREVEKGAVSSQRSGQALEEILERINEVSMQISQIATAAEQQTATTSEVTTNIQQITAVVHQTAKGAEETAGAAAQLAGQAQDLQDLVSRFRLA